MAKNEIDFSVKQVMEEVNVVRVERLPYPGPSIEGGMQEGQMAFRVYRGIDLRDDTNYFWQAITPETNAAFEVFEKERADVDEGLLEEAEARYWGDSK